MKQFILSLSVFLLAIGASAQSSVKYTLTFQNLDMMHVKPVIQITKSLFEAPVEIENDNYNVMIYHTSKVVKKEDVESLLKQNGFKLSSFKSEEE
jgi:hypothetical protein